jgi:hypothetical protein
MFTNTFSGINAFMHGIFIDHCFSGDFVGISQNVSLTAMRSFDSRFHTSLHISENELTHQTVLSLHYKPRFVQETFKISFSPSMSPLVKLCLA